MQFKIHILRENYLKHFYFLKITLFSQEDSQSDLERLLVRDSFPLICNLKDMAHKEKGMGRAEGKASSVKNT